MKKIIVIHHSADFDGLFCREIARKFLPEAELIGWDFADKPLAIPDAGTIYVLDLPVDRVFGIQFAQPPKTALIENDWLNRVIWIDHHKSSIDSHPQNIPGYRIDGVAACRLAWQWFTNLPPGKVPEVYGLPNKGEYFNRTVSEPYAVQLAGEYDVWDKRNPDADTFQFGLRSVTLTYDYWANMLNITRHPDSVDTWSQLTCRALLCNGGLLQRYQQQTDKGVMGCSFLVTFEGLKFLALNTPRCNSLTFAAKDIPKTGHDALMGFYWNGTAWNVSLYHANHRKDLDLSKIAVQYGGGGHRGACGFRLLNLEAIGVILHGPKA